MIKKVFSDKMENNAQYNVETLMNKLQFTFSKFHNTFNQIY